MRAGRSVCIVVTAGETSAGWKLVRVGGMACMGIGVGNRGLVYSSLCGDGVPSWCKINNLLVTWD